MNLAVEVSKWTSCLRRQVGCVITVDRRLVATGYNGAPAGIESCADKGFCLRESSPSGENLDNCLAVHAEQNAITQAAKYGISIKGGDLYVTTYPCATCMKLIINAGLKRVYYMDEYNSPLAKKLAEEANLEVTKISFEKN